MIQEKDFLYRVPVKNVLVTTPRQQVRNPEILVDLEGGEFMHGNILDANSTNKLINQSVKDAVDNKLIESGYVTQDLLEAETTRATEQENSLKTLIGAETSARTKGDEDLSAKIQAEQTRAEGKEKEISDKLAIVDGDSNTEGSFRKAIADVIAAAPEDLDTLKEIADKLAGNDDLHTALNQAITEKADASALLNEVTRATGVENNLQAAIDTKADATALSSYVLTAALNQQVDTLNTAISAKQDAGNYITFENRGLNDDYGYIIKPEYYIECRTDKFDNDKYNYSVMSAQYISVENASGRNVRIDSEEINIDSGGDASNDYHLSLSPNNISSRSNSTSNSLSFQLNDRGVKLEGGRNTMVLTSNASTIDITQYALKSELPTVPTKTSQLTNDSNFIVADVVDQDKYTLFGQLKFGVEANGQLIIDAGGIRSDVGGGFSLFSDGISFNARKNNEIPTADGDFINIDDYALNSQVTALEQTVTANTTAIEGKQDKGNYIAYDNYNGHAYTLNGELMLGEEFSVLTLSNTGITLGGPGGSGFMLSSDSIEINNGQETVNINPAQISSTANEVNQFKITPDSIILGNDTVPNVKISKEGIKFVGKTSTDIPTANGTFINIIEQIDHAVNDYNFISQQQADSRYALVDTVDSLSAGLSAKQNKITVNEVDVTDIETADITKLRTIVTNLINALSESDLIRETKTLE